MNSGNEAYLPVQRIAQACLECRYAFCISPHVVVTGCSDTDPGKGGKNAVVAATGLFADSVKD
jgi:hypothetical protein